MEKAKAHDLYAWLGLASQHASQTDIRDAYWKLASRFGSDERFRKSRPDTIKVQNAYKILGNPEKRAEYDQARARVHQGVKSTPKRTCKSRDRSPLGEGPLAFRQQLPQQVWILQLQASKRAGRRRTPPRAQLRVQAQLRAHASYLAQMQQEQLQLRQEHLQALREEIREAEINPFGAFEKAWALLSEMFELDEVNEMDEQKALVREALEQEAKSREEKAACEQEAAAQAAAQARTKEIEWINKEAADSILVLDGMGARPTRPSATGYAQMLQEDYVRRLVEKTNDLLDYLWDKAHSGDWICPEIKDAVDLDWLLGLILQRGAQTSYFPSATRKLAASLLRKWRGEDCDATDEGTSFAQETDSPLFSDSESSDSESSEGGSSSDDSDSDEEAPGGDLQFYIQAAKPQHLPFARNAAQPSPFAQGVQQSSPFAQNAQQKSPFPLSNQQHNIGAEVSLAGYKRVLSPDPYEEQENQRSKRQKHISYV